LSEEKYKEPEQVDLFQAPPPEWQKQWKGMPEFHQEDQSSWRSLIVHFRNHEDRKAFGGVVGQNVTQKTRSIWYPRAEIEHFVGKCYVTEEKIVPRYPIYVISKGRWDSRMTVKALENMHIAYRIVVEPQEFNQYAAVISPEKILTLPFSNLGQGSIPARNWVWEHSIQEGHARHWILDDNISGFFRLNNNLKVPVSTGATFKAIEDFTDRYENVAKSGMNYFMFAPRKNQIPPLAWNTRVYSCILLDNRLALRWRGKYNEDTDLSIRILKEGHCTVLFNAFLAFKIPTMQMKGGNTDELYKGDGRFQMAESLRLQHPEIVKIVEKWGRFQHSVDYSQFKKNKPILREGIVLTEGDDNYGMDLLVDARFNARGGSKDVDAPLRNIDRWAEKAKAVALPAEVVPALGGHLMAGGSVKACSRCHCAPVELPTECPGKSVWSEDRDKIKDGKLDYRGGVWVTL
jgi:hypothetical protein